MDDIAQLETNRLILRQWQAQDYAHFAKINNDPLVMEYYPSILTELESNALAKRIEDLISTHGWGFWALELKENNQFIGFVGLNRPVYELPTNPCVEIGWRLAKNYWRNGYATEAANAALKYAFEILQLTEVVSFASVNNIKSIAVMKRLHMLNTLQNFDHPDLALVDHLREHVLYKITKTQWNNI